jgi:hypothetical protein
VRRLIKLAEDSPAELDAYIAAGRVLAALDGGETIGHLQIIERDRTAETEVKNMAVDSTRRTSDAASAGR